MMKELIYIADPMCSWCWGFSPVIQQIVEDYRNQLIMTLVVGGLRSETTQPHTDEMKQYSLKHWHHVHELTGQPFNFEFNTPVGFVYNTEPACRAAVTLKQLQSKSTFLYLETLHRAFYVDNADLTDESVLVEIAHQFDIDKENFSKVFNDDATRRATALDFHFAKRLGISGFPSIVLNDTDGYKLLTSGYRNYDELKPLLEAWATGQLG
jgi:putative protein-disulfide isomerase